MHLAVYLDISLAIIRYLEYINCLMIRDILSSLADAVENIIT